MVEAVIPYFPRPLQARLHTIVKRFSVLVCHRRFGKTVWGVNHLIDRVMTCRLQRPQAAYLAPTYGQAKRVAWEFAKFYTSTLPGVTYYETELRIELPGDRRIMLLGAENPDSLRGIYLDAVVLDEYADMHGRVFAEIIRPALSDRAGSGVWIGTPKGLNQFHDIYVHAQERVGLGDPDWFAALYRASETGILPQKELDAARAVMSEEQYAQEYECDFGAAVSGAYFAKLIAEAVVEQRITRVPYFAEKQVHTVWDLGVHDGCAIWFFQVVGRLVHVIDYYEASGVGLPHYVKVLRERPYLFGRHFVPHDAKVTEFGSGKTRIEMAASLGVRMDLVPELPLPDGIESARVLLRRCLFDQAKCGDGLKALRNYHQQWDDRRKAFLPKPYHDWSSHAADAFRYLSLVADRVAEMHGPPRVSIAEGTENWSAFG